MTRSIQIAFLEDVYPLADRVSTTFFVFQDFFAPPLFWSTPVGRARYFEVGEFKKLFLKVTLILKKMDVILPVKLTETFHFTCVRVT